MTFSYWEQEYLKADVHIIGAGIVGLSAAIALKEKNKNFSVCVIDRFLPSRGASTRNAGFVCFGSPIEIADDLSKMAKNEVEEIVNMRWEGSKILQDRLAKRGVSINNCGGFEIFDSKASLNEIPIDDVNEIMLQATGIKDYNQLITQSTFSTMSKQAYFMKEEGRLDTNEMYSALYDTAVQVGVKFLSGYSVSSIDKDQKRILFHGSGFISFDKLMVCTNGFTKELFPHLEVSPARNHVLITNELPQLKWDGVYHFDSGYYYFRRVGQRILLGGARNFDPIVELTSDFSFNETIRSELVRFLENEVLPKEVKYSIDHWWTGILGIGESKYPILKDLGNDLIAGVRLGGMGVAIGSLLGKKLADMV